MSRRGSVLQGVDFNPMTFEGQIQGAQIQQRTNEFNAQQKQQKQAAKAKEQGDATGYITGLNVPDIGDNTIDLYNDAQLKGVQDELKGMMDKGAGLNEIKMAAMPKLQKIAQGYTIAKNEYSKITEAQKNLMKDYPEGNAEAARNVMGKGMLDNIFERDEKGNVKGYKDLSIINSNRNYSEDLFDPAKMDTWYPSSTNEVVSNIQKTRGLTPIEGQVKIINPRGGYTDKKYKGDISIYDRPTVDEDGKITGIQLDSETVSLGKNQDGTANIIQVMPKEKYEVLRGNGKAAMQFDKAVYDHLAKDVGINPKSLDPQALDIYSRNYALQMLEKTGLQGSSYNQFDVEKANPIKNITNNNIKVGGNKDVTINDVYGRIENATKKADIVFNGSDKRGTRMNTLDADAQKVIFDYVGDPELDERNSFIVNDNGAMKVYRLDDTQPSASNPNGVPNLDERFVITTLPKVGVNIKVQANTKGKEAVVKQGEANRSGKDGGKLQVQSRKGKDGKTYTSTDGITWKAADGTTVTLQK